MTKQKQDAGEFSGEALDALIGANGTPEELEALFRQMKRRVVERISHFPLILHPMPLSPVPITNRRIRFSRGVGDE